jgi:hypothetical protein
MPSSSPSPSLVPLSLTSLMSPLSCAQLLGGSPGRVPQRRSPLSARPPARHGNRALLLAPSPPPWPSALSSRRCSPSPSLMAPSPVSSALLHHRAPLAAPAHLPRRGALCACPCSLLLHGRTPSTPRRRHLLPLLAMVLSPAPGGLLAEPPASSRSAPGIPARRRVIHHRARRSPLCSQPIAASLVCRAALWSSIRSRLCFSVNHPLPPDNALVPRATSSSTFGSSSSSVVPAARSSDPRCRSSVLVSR